MFFIEVEFRPCVTEFSGISQHLSGQTEAGTMSVIDVFDGLFPRNTVRIQHTGRDYVT